MKPSLKVFVIALLASSLGWQGQIAWGLEKLTVIYGAIGGGMWPVMVAEKRGIFVKNGLAITFVFVEGGSRAMTVIVSGQSPLAHGVEPISAALGGADAVAVASLVNTLNFDLIVTREINLPEDLKGKRIAISRFGSNTDFASQLALRKLGLNPKEVAFLQVGSNPARVNAMIAGQVQGALLNSDTHAPQARKLGLRTLASLPDLGIEFMQSCLVTTRSYVRTHSHLVRSYIKALVEAIAWLKDERNRSEGQKIMGDFLRNQDTELMENMYESLVKKVFQPAPYPTVGAVQNMLDHLALTNPKARQAKAEDFIDNRFIRELDESGFIKGLYRR